MSIESLSIAMMHSRSRGTTKLVLLGIANHDGDGGAWPAVSTLMRYAGGIDRRRVQRCLTELEQLGEIRRLQGQGGDHSTADHRRPNLYRFLLACPHDCDRSSQHRTARSTPMMPLEGLGAVEGPHAVVGPPDGLTTGGGGGPQTAQTIPLTRTTQERELVSVRAGESALCRNGHPIIATSGSGIPFCALGCAPALTLVDA